MIKHTMGADFELFILKDREVLSPSIIMDRISCSKYDGFLIKKDGLALEVCISPDSCREIIWPRIWYAIDYIEQNLKDGEKISFWPIKKINPEKYSEEELEMGCSPSLNAWTGKEGRVSVGPLYPYRSLGGHIHHSFMDSTIDRKKEAEQIVKMMDLLVAIPLLLITPNLEAERERKLLYGKAGEYRLVDYTKKDLNKNFNYSRGIEYRVPSVFIFTKNEIFSAIYGLARMSICMIRKEQYVDIKDGLTGLIDDKLRYTIDTQDLDMAEKIYLELLDILDNKNIIESGENISYRKNIIENYKDIIRNIKILRNPVNLHFNDDDNGFWNTLGALKRCKEWICI